MFVTVLLNERIGVRGPAIDYMTVGYAQNNEFIHNSLWNIASHARV